MYTFACATPYNIYFTLSYFASHSLALYIAHQTAVLQNTYIIHGIGFCFSTANRRKKIILHKSRSQPHFHLFTNTTV